MTVDTRNSLDTRHAFAARRWPGGFSPEFLRLELRRLMRNRRTVIVALVVPPAFFAIFGAQSSLRTQAYGSGNVTGYVMVSMAVYGAMLATTIGAAMVALERAAGWNRQLRLTPLRPAAYIATKVAAAMTLSLLSVAVVFVVGAVSGAKLPGPAAWASCFVLAWLGSLVFAAFGLFIGYLLPMENVMQLLGFVLALLAFAGGLFMPLHGWFETASKVVPTNGIATLARIPFGDSGIGSILIAVCNVVFWVAVFGGGAALLFRRDAAR